MRNYRKVVITYIAILMAVLSVLATGTTLWILKNFKTDESTIQFISDYPDNTITRTYGETLDLSKLEVTFKDGWGKETTLPATDNNITIEGYDPEYIGKQSITFSYLSHKEVFYIFTSPANIVTPYLRYADNNFSWSPIPHSKSYRVYSKVAESDYSFVAETTETHYDITDYSIDGYSTFRIQAVKESDKYVDSDFSNEIKVYHLAKATNIAYVDKTISWNAVDGASSYSLFINGTEIKGLIDTTYNHELPIGHSDIKVVSYSNIENSTYSTSSIKGVDILNAVENISCDSNTLYWNAVAGANAYDVYVDDVFYGRVHNNQISTTGFAEGIYKVGIIASNDDSGALDSKISNFNCVINFFPTANNGVLSWNNLGSGVTYSVYLDGTKVASNISVTTYDLNTHSLSEGNHIANVVVETNKVLNINHDIELTLNKLSTPILVRNDNQLIVSNGDAHVTMYKDSVEFDGNLSSITTPGQYNVNAYRYATTASEIDSNYCSTIVFTKLSAPTISFDGTALTIDDTSKAVTWYDGSSAFSGDLDDLEVGSHTIKAVYSSTGDTIIQSEFSNSITLNKLATPTIAYENATISCIANNINLQYYANNIEFDGNFDSLESGTYTVYAKNIGNGVDEANSNASNVLTIKKVNYSFTITQLSGEMIRITKPSGVDRYDLVAMYYQGGSKLDSSYNYETTNVTSDNKSVSYRRGSVVADRVELIIKVKDNAQQSVGDQRVMVDIA